MMHLFKNKYIICCLAASAERSAWPTARPPNWAPIRNRINYRKWIPIVVPPHFFRKIKFCKYAKNL